MEPIYLGDLISSIASSKKIIEKYDKGIKEGEFYEEPLGVDFNYPDGWICLLKITFALTDWIRYWRKWRNKNISIDECIKFVQWKLEDYKLSDSDKRIIESILLYACE